MKYLTFEKVSSKHYSEILDFVVSGKSILAELDRRGYNVVPRVCAGLVPIDQKTRAHLLLQEDDELSNGRVALYTCPCGDYGCGVISVLIKKHGDQIVWSDFRYERDDDEEFTALERLGPFRFAEDAYRRTVMCSNTTT
ncbi:MAG: hypothetical protein R3D97_07915 [Paracoccaceae bacterium]